jgi:hypothetical protein
VTLTFAVAVAEWLLVEVATIATVAAAEGAVNVALAPLAVCAGVKVPQEPTGVQLQSTPAFALSFDTAAATGAVALTVIVAGGAVARLMDVAAGGGVGCEGGFPPFELVLLVPTVPHPERLAMTKRTNEVSNMTLRALRIGFTMFSVEASPLFIDRYYFGTLRRLVQLPSSCVQGQTSAEPTCSEACRSTIGEWP